MTTRQPLTLHSGSRLHFGLWGWGPEYEHQFGGVGMMIDRPAINLRISTADELDIVGPAAARVRKVAEGCTRYWGWLSLPACRIELLELPPQHVGLGTGTQLDLLVARGLAEWQGEEVPGLAELALAVDRGGRSSVGTHGFAQGGLLVETGRGPGDTLGKLLHRVDVPAAWRILLVIPVGETGLSGRGEREAFDNLPPVPQETHEQMVELACHQLVPAAAKGDFERFASALYTYGQLAGKCYSTIQPATYYSDDATRLVESFRNAGFQGVAQSSWGPTLFVVFPSEEEAKARAKQVKGFSVEIAQPQNTGAVISGID